MNSLPGIGNISISLSTNSAVVSFENGLLSAIDIIAVIDDGGFEASLSLSSPDLIRSHSPEIYNAIAPRYPPVRNISTISQPRSRPGSPSSPIARKLGKSGGTPIPVQKVSEQSVIVTLRVEGMTCASCVASIERHLSGQSGIISARVALLAERADIEYILEQYPDPQMVADLIVSTICDKYCRTILGLKRVVLSHRLSEKLDWIFRYFEF